MLKINKILLGAAALSMLSVAPVDSLTAEEYEDSNVSQMYVKLNYNLAYGLAAGDVGTDDSKLAPSKIAGKLDYAGVVAAVGINVADYCDVEVEGFYQMNSKPSLALKNAKFGGIASIGYSISNKDLPVDLYVGLGAGYMWSASLTNEQDVSKGYGDNIANILASVKTGFSYNIPGYSSIKPYSDVRMTYVFAGKALTKETAAVIGNLEVGVKFIV